MALLEMCGIVKRFPGGVLANDQIDLDLRAGEIHALLGENGAGKSTLMKILAGTYTPDAGEIRVRGERVTIRSPRDARRLKIGMVYQHFMLVDSLTALDNFLIGLDGASLIPNRRAFREQIDALAEGYGLQVPLDASVWQLSIGEQQRIELLRLLHRQAEILILDEPTAVLTPQAVDALLNALQRMADNGKAVILITHKIKEVLGHADRVTVLRAGRNVATLAVSETTPLELTRLMLGRDLISEAHPGKPPGEAAVLKVRDLQVRDDRRMMAVRGVSLDLREGEIVGIAGVAGNGQRELAEALVGLRPLVKGQVQVRDAQIAGKSAEQIIAQGVAYIPEDRMRVGSALGLSVSDNLIMKQFRQPALSRGGMLRLHAIGEFARRLIAAFEVRPASTQSEIGTLSGGNIQKVILAREISANPVVIVAMQPTRGLDIGAAEAIRRRLIACAEQGSAILLISEDLDELFAVCHRIAVIHAGEWMGIVDAQHADVDQFGLMMAGALKLAG